MPPPFSIGGEGHIALPCPYVPSHTKKVYFGDTFFHTISGHIASLMNASETRKNFHKNLYFVAIRMLLHENPQQFVSSFFRAKPRHLSHLGSCIC